MRITAIAAISKHNRAIGNNGEIPWRIKADMDRFKAITLNHPVIMGRKTWLSLPERFRPLPDRTNIVLTSSRGSIKDPARIATTLHEAVGIAHDCPGGNKEVFIIGGGQVYSQALPYVTRIYLTLVDLEVPQADAFFPEYEGRYNVVEEQHFSADGKTPAFTFQTLDRKAA